MTSTPTPPDRSHDATDLGDGGNLPNPEAPSRVGVGFPTGAVRALRNAIEHPRAEEDVTLSRIAGLAVLAWIDRYVPRAIRTVEHEIQVGGVGVFTIESEEPFVDSVELIRLNGRPFVPEVSLAVEDGEVVIGGDRFVRLDHDMPIEEAVSIIVKGRRFVPETPAIVEDACCIDCHGTGDTGLGFHHVCGRCAGTGREPTVPVRHPEWPLTPPVNHEAANRERAGVCDTVEARAARRSFAEPQADPIHKGGGRTSIHRSHRAEGGPNFVD